MSKTVLTTGEVEPGWCFDCDLMKTDKIRDLLSKRKNCYHLVIGNETWVVWEGVHCFGGFYAKMLNIKLNSAVFSDLPPCLLFSPLQKKSYHSKFFKCATIMLAHRPQYSLLIDQLLYFIVFQGVMQQHLFKYREILQPQNKMYHKLTNKTVLNS